MMDKNSVRRFVRETLGCTCPEKVFQHIEVQTDVAVHDDVVLDYEINVGKRLLIYVVAVDELGVLGLIIPQLVRIGTYKRNEYGFNRFRLVLLTQKAEALTEEASTIFKSLDVATDEKVHLHVIDRENLPDIRYPP
jgi:hypothetical protein